MKFTGEVDVLKEMCERLNNELMKQDVTDEIQAEKHERTEERDPQRNGYWDRVLTT